MALLKTIDFIVHNPRRSRTWKVVDVTFLVVLWMVTAISLYLWFVNDDFNLWSVAWRFLLPITIVATARSWYRYPNSRVAPRREGDDFDPDATL